MKQLYYTSCKTGRSVNGMSGFQVRAASRGLSPDQQAQVVAAASYGLPAGVPEESQPDKAPRRLALSDVQGLGRVLCHTAYVGQDPDTGRMGNYFLHAVVGSPRELDALTAVKSWNSPFWKTRDSDGPTDLQDVSPPALTPGPSLNEQVLPSLAGRYRKELEFLLSGLLTATPEQRLFLVADPDVMAACVYCLLFAVPQKLLSDFTFSTYEREPLTSSARIVATCWAAGHQNDLDSQCYDGMGYGFNPLSGQSSPGLQPPPEFATFAAAALQKNGGLAELRQFLQECDRLDVADGPGVALLYRLLRGRQQMTIPELRQPVAQRVADRLGDRAELPTLLADAALADSEFRSKVFPVYFRALQRKTVALSKMTSDIRAKAFEALQKGNLGTARVALEELLPTIDPSFQAGQVLLKGSLDPRSLPLNVRLHFLPRVLSAAGQAADDGVRRWLAVEPAELPSLLGCLTTDQHRLVAADLALEQAGAEALPAAALTAFTEIPTFGLKIVAKVAPRAQAKAEGLFKRLVEHAPRHDWASDVMRCGEPGRPDLSPPLKDRLLAIAVAKLAKQPLRQWATANAGRLQRDFPDGNAPVEVARRILQEHADNWSGDPALEPFIRWVSTTKLKDKLPKGLQQQVEYQYGIKSFCEKPALDDGSLRTVAAALQRLPDQDLRPTWKRVLGAVLPVRGWSAGCLRDAELERVLTQLLPVFLARRGDKARVALEGILAHLGPVYAGPGHWVPLFRELMSRCERDSSFWRNDGTLYAFVAVGVGETDHAQLRATRDPEQAKLPDEMEQYVLSKKRRNAESPALVFLKGQLRTWSDAKRAARWEFKVFDEPGKGEAISWTTVLLILVIGYIVGSWLDFGSVLRLLRGILGW